MVIDALALLLVIVAAFFFGYYTGRDRARDEAAFDKAKSGLPLGEGFPRFPHAN